VSLPVLLLRADLVGVHVGRRRNDREGCRLQRRAAAIAKRSCIKIRHRMHVQATGRRRPRAWTGTLILVLP
jgi:hypothetical protein